MINKVTGTDTILSKAKSVFRNVFDKKTIKESKNESINNTSFREQFQEDRRKKVLAEKLLDGKMGVYDLTDIEVEEMTDYFIKDMEAMDNELARIKAHILAMQKQLKNI